jgi:hypothetical protein
MSEKTDIILKAIKPARSSVDAGTLTYPNLRSVMKQFGFLSFVKRGSEVIASKRQIPSVSLIKHDFYVAYLLNASYRLQRADTAVEKIFWTQQFSASSIRLFGKPDSREVSSLASDELMFFQQISEVLVVHKSFAEPLLVAYRQLAQRAKIQESLEERFAQTFHAIQDYYFQKYNELFHCFDAYDSVGQLEPNDIYKAFSEALTILQRDHSDWRGWKVVMPDSGGLSVSVRSKKINVGRYRIPVSSQEVRGIFAHEVLVHAQRAVNASTLASEFQTGLEGYLTAEEGLGVLVESAINGKVAYKVKDRYVDVSLALGSYRKKGYSRDELFLVCYTRTVLRSIVDGSMASLDDIEQGTWEHINRIFRGTLGNRYVGVFTKDIAYYEGLIKMAKYISKHRKRYAMHELMDYLLQAKFDPTNKSHTAAVKALTKT